MARKPKTILIADGDLLVRETFKFVFTRAGYRALLATDGQAVARIAASERIDVILLDVQMPLKDGVETLLSIHEAHPGLAVFLLSSAVHDDDPYFVKLALKFGTSGVIRKPISPDKVVGIVNAEIAVPGYSDSVAQAGGL